MSDTSGIEFREAAKRYPDGTIAVESFSLRVPARTTTVLVGSSGCGKTTLLRMVNRMVEPTSGAVLIDGEDIDAVDPVALRRRHGYVMQNSGLLPHRNVADNVATVPRLTGTPRAAARTRALELLELVGLSPDLAGRYPAQLSGGQQQRVGVARALAADPNLLLMDEPFGAVDPIVRAELQDELARLARELAKTVLFVTHDIEEACRLGDEVVILRAGARIAQAGPPDAVLAHPADEVVASFVGAARERRVLHRDPAPGSRRLLDEQGRPAGTLE
jgi:osmoprotectant transport system ATP-binding protein